MYCEKCMDENVLKIFYSDSSFFKNSFKKVKQAIADTDSWEDFSKKYYAHIYKFSFAGHQGDEIIFGSKKSYYDNFALFYKGYLIGFLEKL